MRIVVFGDNVTHGHWDSAGGWVQRLRTNYDKQTIAKLDKVTLYPDIYNLGVAGATAEGLVKRLSIEMQARSGPEAPVIVVAIGINDTMIYKGVETNTTEMFEGELQQILAAATQYTDKLLFVGMHSVDETVCNPWKYSPEDVCFKNDRILQFEQILREFCKKSQKPIVKVFEQFQGKRIDENLLADGLHPNEAGHQLIAERVKPELDKLLV